MHDAGQHRAAEPESDVLPDGWQVAGVKERTYVTGVWAGYTVVTVELERFDGLRTMGAGQTREEAIAAVTRRIAENA